MALYSLFDTVKQKYHKVGLNSLGHEELRGAMADYLLEEGDFNKEEREQIASWPLGNLVTYSGLHLVAHDDVQDEKEAVITRKLGRCR